MKKIETDEIQKYLLMVMEKLDLFCRENGLRYYLSGGTLLGAVRHKGFIPWDDDIDIMIPRKDYEKLVSTFADDRYKIAYCERDKDYGCPYARMWDSHTIRDWGNMSQTEMGVYIDILPIDGYPDSLILSKIREYYLLYIRKWRLFMMYNKSAPTAKFKRLKQFVRKINPNTANDYSVRINKIGRKIDFETSKYVGVQSGTYHAQKERNPKSVFDKTIYLQFEHLWLPAPSGYDEYLKHLFGDYMQLPPVEQRVKRHGQDIYLIEE